MDEVNTYGLPQGAKIAASLRKSLDAQRRNLLRELAKARPPQRDEPEAGADLMLPPLDPDPEEMADSVRPAVVSIWDAAGGATMAQLNEIRAAFGLDDAAWSVTDQNLDRVIREQAYSFCVGLYQDCDERVREQLSAGLKAGETISAIAKRLESVFKDAAKSRVRMIARTEAAWAHHAAQDASARESGVVAGWEWLASSNACKLCLAIRDEVGRVPLGMPFALAGDNPAYRVKAFPPRHPNCQCSVLYVLKPEYGGPANPEWGKTLILQRCEHAAHFRRPAS